MIYRVFVEKKENLQAKKIREDLSAQLGIAVEDLREVIRYDAEGLSEEELQGAIVNVFSEPPVDNVWREELPVGEGYKVFAIAFLDGQYDQRADSAAQCIQLLTQKARPLPRAAAPHSTADATSPAGAPADLARTGPGTGASARPAPKTPVQPGGGGRAGRAQEARHRAKAAAQRHFQTVHQPCPLRHAGRRL